MRKLTAAAVIAIALGTAATILFAGFAGHEPAGREITVALNAEPNNLDPASAPFAANLRVTHSIFDTLIARDYRTEIQDPARGLTLRPGLAEAWRRLDERTIELTLRRGVTFHSGRALTSADVVFSLSKERIFGDAAIAAQARPYLGDIASVEAVDSHTVRVASARPNATLEYQLASPQAAIVPADAYAGGADAFKRHPIGTGPLRFKRWRDGERLEFEANESYFGGAPNFRRLTFRFVPEQSSRIAGLVSGEFDLIVQVTPDQIGVLRSYRDIHIATAPLQSTQEILFDTRHAVVSNALVRRALSLAIDRAAIVRTILHGQTSIPTSWQIPEMGAIYQKDRNALAYDPGLARQLLREGGYNGEVVTLRFPSGYYPNGDAIAQAVANMWNAVGVTTRIAATETIGQITAGGSAASLISFTYDMPMPEKAVCAYRGPSTWSAQWMPRMTVFYDGCGRLPGLFQADERRQLFATMLDDIEAAMPSALLYQQPQAFAMRRAIGFQPYPHLVMDFRKDAFSIGETGH